MTRKSVFVFILTGMLTIPTACLGDKAVQLHVGKKPVTINNSVPVILADDVGVPVRQFAETLGAKVEWDDATSTITIRMASDTGIIQVGSRSGQIKGTKVWFPYAPYVYNGQVYAPLMFFNQMYDQAWYWDPYTRQFIWVPIFPRWHGGLRNPPYELYKPPSQPVETAVPASKTAVGMAVRALPSTASPRMVAVVGGKTVTYAIAPGAVILRGAVGYRAAEASLGSIRPGDKLILQFNDQGQVTMLRAQYEYVTGHVKSIANYTILLESGESLKVGPKTRILLQGNQACCIQDVNIGDLIVASASPVTGMADVLNVQTPAAPAVGTEATAPPETAADQESDQITLNTLGPLRAGDVLIVRFKAEPGGQAWFTVPGASANIDMTEEEPGTYVGRYTAKQGDMIVAQPVKVTFQDQSGESYTKVSSRLISAQTVAGYLPRITSPRQGEKIDSPVVVQGVAQPGSLVRVVIDFRRVIGTFYPYAGTTAIQDVRSDDSGHWQTPPLAAVMPFSDSEPPMPFDLGVIGRSLSQSEESPTVYTITAISIGVNGQEKSAYSIDVTKQPGATVEG